MAVIYAACEYHIPGICLGDMSILFYTVSHIKSNECASVCTQDTQNQSPRE